MPEMYFKVRWPDGVEELCYSPSTVVKEYLAVGKRYSIAQFLALARPALNRASERVEAKYGYRCSSADDQLAVIEASAARVMGPHDNEAGEVVVTYLGPIPP
jgi:uncharacterized repeat protein (TIGR04042 family)